MINLNRDAESIRFSPEFQPWTGVTVYWDDTVLGFAGTENGRVLEVECYGGSQEMAEYILSLIDGEIYQPFEASDALLDPAAEIGDTVLIDGIVNIAASVTTRFDGLCAADISAPGDEDIDHEYPYEDSASRNAKLALKEAQGARADITVGLDTIRLETENTVKELESKIELVPGRISLEAVNDANGQTATIKLLVDGEETARGQILMNGNVTISGQLSADALYAEYGDIADLTVNRLSTSRRIAKYIRKDTSDDNFIKIENETISFIAGIYSNGEEQATNPYGELLYWERDPAQDGVSIGANGHYYLNGAPIYTTTTTTPWPVMVYTYTEQVKSKFAFENEATAQDGSAIYTPGITLGAGNAQGQNIAKVIKGLNGLEILYLSNTGKTVGMRGTTDGYLDPYGLRRTDSIDFSMWSTGYFYEGVEGDATQHAWHMEFDRQSRPVSITSSDGHKTTITWPVLSSDMPYDQKSFLSGVAVGRQFKGWGTRPDSGSVTPLTPIIPPVSGLVQFYPWATANAGADFFTGKAAYTDFVETLPFKQAGPDGAFYWTPTIDTVSFGSSRNFGAGQRVWPDAVWGNLEYVKFTEKKLSETDEGYIDWSVSFVMKYLRGFVFPRITMDDDQPKDYFYDSLHYGRAVHFHVTGTCPVSGTYKGIASRAAFIYCVEGTPVYQGVDIGALKNLSRFRSTEQYKIAGGEHSGVFRQAGSSLSLFFSYPLPAHSRGKAFGGIDFWLYPPIYRVTPPPEWATGGTDDDDDDYSAAGRAGNIRGSFAILTDDEMSASPRNYIVDEDKKIVYNPVINRSFDFADWRYDYETRTYTLSLTAMDTTSDSGEMDENMDDETDENKDDETGEEVTDESYPTVRKIVRAAEINDQAIVTVNLGNASVITNLEYVRSDTNATVSLKAGTANFQVNGNVATITAFTMLYNAANWALVFDTGYRLPIEIIGTGTYEADDATGDDNGDDTDDNGGDNTDDSNAESDDVAYVIFGDTEVTITDFLGQSFTVYYAL